MMRERENEQLIGVKEVFGTRSIRDDDGERNTSRVRVESSGKSAIGHANGSMWREGGEDNRHCTHDQFIVLLRVGNQRECYRE